MKNHLPPLVVINYNNFYWDGRFEKNDRMRFSMNAPNFLCLPDLVNGIPVSLEILDLNAEMPRNRFQEKPPLFIC